MVEHGQPVSIQVCELNNIVTSSVADRPLPKATGDSQGGPYVEATDLKSALKLLDEGIPCCALIAKVISFNLSQGRRHREVLRTVRKDITTRFPPMAYAQPGDKVRGYQMILKGRVGGSERSRVFRYRSGPMPRHTVSAAIDHGFSEVKYAFR